MGDLVGAATAFCRAAGSDLRDFVELRSQRQTGIAFVRRRIMELECMEFVAQKTVETSGDAIDRAARDPAGNKLFQLHAQLEFFTVLSITGCGSRLGLKYHPGMGLLPAGSSKPPLIKTFSSATVVHARAAAHNKNNFFISNQTS